MTGATRAGHTLVVAGLWVRPMAQSAARAGWRVIALDLFGDRDTREVCAEWHGIGDAARVSIDAALLRAGLQRAAADPGVIGWVAGAGFEADPSLLDAGGALPRFGAGVASVCAVRDARRWFETLDRLGLAHPPVDLDAVDGGPVGQDGLVKSMRGSGGWHIRRAGAGVRLRAGEYLQARVDGRSLSALFLADGTRACIVAVSAQDVRPLGDHPFVYHGATGPAGDDRVRAAMQRGLDAQVPAFGLRGLASADVIVTGDEVLWLEINPRPSATMVLYDDGLPHGLMHAHLRACGGELAQSIDTPRGLRGHRIVYADRDIDIDPGLSDELAARPDHHDLPTPGAHVAAGQPVCSVSARAADEAGLQRRLDVAAAAVLARCAHAAAPRLPDPDRPPNTNRP